MSFDPQADASFDSSSSLTVPPPPKIYPNLPQSQAIQYPNVVRRDPRDSLDCKHVLNKGVAVAFAGISSFGLKLYQVFGKADFKGKQKEVVDAAVRGADIVVIAPTGMGKSICFQVPAVAERHGITLVVSPLLALMKNQVKILREHHVNVAAFTSETSASEKAGIVNDLRSRHPQYRLIYITPEKLCTAEFMKLLRVCYDQQKLNRLVVDEAHCISEWGNDFRKEYSRLGLFRDEFPACPIMALTASATKEVQDDIIQSLKLSTEHLFKVVHPFNRSNLFYEVRYLAQPTAMKLHEEIHSFIATIHRRRGQPSSGVVYCRHRAACDGLANYLCNKGVAARPFHRGIKQQVLDKTMAEWQAGGRGQGGVDVVCATLAFGMGIDKEDVRYIIHYDLPKSLEAYYQETGRAGRDGNPAKCLLYYAREDVVKVKKLLNLGGAQGKKGSSESPDPRSRSTQSFTALVRFAETTTVCRHVSICRYFGEVIDTNDQAITTLYCSAMCDICKYPDKTRNRKAVLSTEEYVSSQASRLEEEVEMSDNDGSNPLPANPRMPQVEGCGDSEGERNTFPVGKSVPATVEQPIPVNSRENLKRKGGPMENFQKSKKPRVVVKPPLNSIPLMNSKSHNTLTKQFKVPFATANTLSSTGIPSRAIVYPPRTSPSASDTINIPGLGESYDHQSDEEEGPIMAPSPPAAIQITQSSSPLDLPEVDLQPEASFSEKIPPGIRIQSLDSLRKSFYKVLTRPKDEAHELWGKIEVISLTPDERAAFILAAAKSVEFATFCLCTSQEGYQSRIQERLRAIKGLSHHLVWESSTVAEESEEIDDSREIVQILHRARASQ